MAQPDWSAFKTGPYALLFLWFSVTTATWHRFAWGYDYTLDETFLGEAGGESGLVRPVNEVPAGIYYGNVLAPVRFRHFIKPNMLSHSIVYSELTLSIAKTQFSETDALMTAVDDVDVISKQVFRVYVVSARDLDNVDADEDLLFVGTPVPNGVKVRADRVEFRLSDFLRKYGEQDLQPKYSRDNTNHDLMADDMFGQPIPIMIGDQAPDTADEDTLFLPVTPLSPEGAPQKYQFIQICDPGPYGLDITTGAASDRVLQISAAGDLKAQAYLDSAGPAFGGPPSDSGIAKAIKIGGAKFNIVEDDEWYLRCNKPNLTSGLQTQISTTIKNPADIWYYLLSHYAGVEAGYINDSSAPYSTVHTYFAAGGGFHAGSGTNPRRFLIEPIKAKKALEELCFEYGLVTYIKNGKFQLNFGPAHMNRVHDGGTSTIHDRLWLGAGGVLELETDPGREYAESVRYFYGYDQGWYPDRDIRAELVAHGYTVEQTKHYDNGGDNFFARGDVTGPSPANEINFKWHRDIDLDAALIAELLRNAAYNGGEGPLGIHFKSFKRFMDPTVGLGQVYQFQSGKLNLPLNEEYIQIYEQNTDLTTCVSDLKGISVDPPGV